MLYLGNTLVESLRTLSVADLVQCSPLTPEQVLMDKEDKNNEAA